MSLFGKIKTLASKNEKAVEGAIDKVADLVETKTDDSTDKKVESAAEKAKDLIDGLDGKKG